MYFCERFPDLKKQKPEEIAPNIAKQIAKEWQKGDKVDIDFYYIKAEKDRIRYKKQLKEFNKFGYYTRPRVRNNKENDDFDEDNEQNKKINKKKRTPIICNKKTKRIGNPTKKIISEELRSLFL